MPFRDSYKKLTPAWLHTGDGDLVLYSLTRLIDIFNARNRAGAESHMPSRAGSSALKEIGRDRGIPRGRDETNAHYGERLKRWRYPRGHRVRGGPFALLEQVSEYFGGVPCWTIDVRGNRFYRAADGTETATHSETWDWDGALPAPNWARFWVVIDMSEISAAHPALDDPALWGGLTLDQAEAAGYTLDQLAVTYQDAKAIRDLMLGERPWRPAGTYPETIVLTFDGTFPAPTGDWDQPDPRTNSGLGFWEIHQDDNDL